MGTIQNINDSVGKYMSIGIHGEPGIGKTAFCGTKPANQRMFIIDEHSGLDVLHSKLFPNKPTNIDFAQVDDVNDVMALLCHLVSGKNSEGIPFIDYYDWIVIDCMTSLAKKFFNNSQKKPINDMRQHYGNAQGDCLRVIGMFVNKQKFPFNTIITFHSAEVEKDMETKSRPHLVGKALDPDIGGTFDVCGYLRLETRQVGDSFESRRIMYCQPNQNWYGKDRSGGIPIPCEPNLAKVVQWYREGLGLE